VTTFLTWQVNDAIDAGSLSFDAVMSIARTSAADVTKRPVEIGASITDHVRKALEECALTVFVTNTPSQEDSNIFVTLQEVRGAMRPLSLSDVIPSNPNVQDTRVGVLYDPPEAVVRAPSRGVQLFDNVSASRMPSVANPIPKPIPVAQSLQFFSSFNAVEETLNLLQLLKDKAVLISVASRDWVLDNMVITKINPTRDRATGSGCTISIDFTEIRIVETLQVVAPALPRAKKPVTSGAKSGSDAPQLESAAAQLTGYKG